MSPVTARGKTWIVLIIAGCLVAVLCGRHAFRDSRYPRAAARRELPPASSPGAPTNLSASRSRDPGNAAAIFPANAEIENIRRRLDAAEPFVPGQIENEAAATLLVRWAELDPQSAIGYAAEREAVHGQPNLPAELFDAWLDRDELAAQQWLAGLPPGTLRSRLTPSLVSLVASRHPVEALKLAVELSGADRERALASVFDEWAVTDPAAASAQALSLPDPRERALAIQEVTSNWSGENLTSAIRWSLGLVPGPERNAALQGLVPEWTAQDPRAAASVLAALPDTLGRSQWLRMVGEKWASQDSPAAISWAASLPVEKDRTEVVRAVLAELAQSDMEKAATVALTLPVGRTRQEGLELVLTRWAAEDVVTARQWLSKLPPGPLRDEASNSLAHARAAQPPSHGDRR